MAALIGDDVMDASDYIGGTQKQALNTFLFGTLANCCVDDNDDYFYIIFFLILHLLSKGLYGIIDLS